MVRRYARFGRLSLRKGEGVGEGLFRQKPVVLEPLTLVLFPCSRGEATKRPGISQGRAGSEMTSVVLLKLKGSSIFWHLVEPFILPLSPQN